MGKIIGGVVVGFITAFLVASILIVALSFVLGTAGIMVPDTWGPTSTFMGVMLVSGLIAHYTGGAIARAIGKDKRAMFGYIALLIAISAFQIISFSGGPPELPPNFPTPSMEISPIYALNYAQMNAPAWFGYTMIFVAIIGAFLGSVNRSDFGSPAAPADAA